MNIILHIGQSKTGTTALQSVLSDNRDVLQQQGILYPDVFLKGIPAEIINHNAFANSLLGFDFYPRLTADEYWQQFSEQFEQGDFHTLLLSGESFFGGRPYLWELDSPDDYWDYYARKILILKKYFKGHSVKIVVYLRPQDKWFESVVPQIVRYEGSLGKTVYESDEKLMELQAPRMDYARLIGLWEKALPSSDIVIREYNPASFENGNIVYDFVNHTGIDHSGFNNIDRPNNPHNSWSTEFIELKKKLNQTSRSRYSEDTIIDIINALDQKIGSGNKYSIDHSLRERIFDQVRAGNDTLSKKYCDGKLFKGAFKMRETSKPSREALDAAQFAFEQKYKSFSGRFLFLLNTFKRILRKKTPALHAFLGIFWRRFKAAKAKFA